jgi:hypothetical protein
MRRSRKPVWAVPSIEGSNPSLSVSSVILRLRAQPEPAEPAIYESVSRVVSRLALLFATSEEEEMSCQPLR